MDTIVYKLHNLSKYPIVLQAVQNLEDGKGKIQVDESHTENKFQKFSTLWFNLKHDFYHIITYNSKMNIKSSESTVTVFYDKGQEVIKFEFSIPKFYYSTNVVEMIPPLHSKYYKPNLNMHDLANYWLKILKVTFSKLIDELTNSMQTNVDFCDVEISRLDISYNQIFDTQRDAYMYLDAQKQIKAKRVLDKKHVNYETSLTIQTNDYYFKIYHKGAEFKNEETPKLYKNFNQQHRENRLNEDSFFYKTFMYKDRLQEYSDRIIRYELECKKPLISYQFAYHLNKQFIPKYREIMKLIYYITDREGHLDLFQQTKKYYIDTNTKKIYKNKFSIPLLAQYERIYFTPNISLDSKKTEYNILVDETKIKKLDKMYEIEEYLRTKHNISDLKQIKNLHKFFKKEQSKEYTFFLDKPKNELDYTKETNKLLTYVETPLKQHFSIEILTLLIKKFEQIFESYQLNEMPSVQHIEQLAIKYNETLKLSGSKKKKININHVKLLFTHLQNGYSLDEMRKTGNYSRSTIHNYRKKIDSLLLLGTNVNLTPNIESKNIVRTPKTLYSRHYNEIINNNTILQVYLSNSTKALYI